MATETFQPIDRTRANDHLNQIAPVGEHRPSWEATDCPSCGTVPCSHPDVLACKECHDDWPCDVVANVALELDRLVAETDWAWAVGDSLRRRASELRGEG